MKYILLLNLFFALVLLLLPRRLKVTRAVFLGVVQSGFLLFFLWNIHAVLRQGVISETIPWVPALGLNLVFVLDGLSLLFALLVTGIGALVFFYAHPYMKSYNETGRFYLYLFLFAGAMLGLVLSGNLLQLFVFWELTTYLSYLLITFFHEKAEARKAAFQALFLTVVGGLGLLAGILLIGSIVDSYLLSDWVNNADLIKEHPRYLAGFLLILLGVMTKSAQFPFHFWLPGAMQAPAPVSTYLHSATMVKAGFFLLVRLNPVLGGTDLWTTIIPMVGVLTMLIGSYFAITQTDLKGILAFTTINALGVLVLLAGVDTRLSIKAALLFLFVHAFYKASLFMIAGQIEKKTGTRDIESMGGLAGAMPVTFVITLLMALSMAGLPPMLGFIGKELIYEAKVALPGLGWIVLVLGVASNVLMVTISLMFVYRIFLGPRGQTPKKPDEKGILFLFGPGILALISLVSGLFPGFLGNGLLESALEVVYLEETAVKLKLWHGFNQVFFLSLATVFTGFALFFVLTRWTSVLELWKRMNQRLFSFRLTDLFSAALYWFLRFSDRNEKMVQHGFHRYYIITIILVASALIWGQVFITQSWVLSQTLSLSPFYVTGLVVIILMATILSTLSRSRLATIISLGVVGYGVAMIYLYFSAIDLAITQILVETLILAMFVLVLQRLPKFARLSSRITKWRDLTIALIFGSVMTVVALKAIQVDFNPPISGYFIENSYKEAFGRNVVNVILVDFRALDTLGEVVVLTVAAFGVSVLLRERIVKT